MDKIYKEVEKTKEKLIKEAKTKGIYENFGQKEYNKLKDKFAQYQYTTDFEPINNFFKWCINFSL